jgi:spore germination protein GerM
MRLSTILSGLALTGVLVACAPSESKGVQLYYYSLKDLNNATYDEPVVVARTISYKENMLYEAAVRELLKGPSKDEARRLNARMSDDLRGLADDLIDVKAEGDTATVNFKQSALEVLNSAAARQMMAKQPIEKTLLQFPEIKNVKYAIDGKEFTEWDA